MAQVAVETPRPLKKKRRGFRGVLKEMRREWTAYLFNAPGLIIFAVFVIYALYTSFILSFQEWDLFDSTRTWVGLDNYRTMVNDPEFRESLGHSIYFVVGTTFPQMAIGLSLALLLNAKLRGMSWFRTAFYLPVITPLVIAAIIWKWVYNANYGLANYYLQKFGLIDEPLLWLADRKLAMPSVIIMVLWKAAGFNMVIYLAGLQAIPTELYEAADVDGASAWTKFRRVTLPLLAPTTFFLLIINIVGGMKAFSEIFVMTNGGPPGPEGVTTTITYYIYEQAFVFFKMGYASALAYTLFAMLFVFSFWQFRWYLKRVEEP